MSLSETALPSHCTPAEAIALFDSLAPTDLDFMMGRWRGAEICTGNPLEGLLPVIGWYGKEFVSAECVHPLMFENGRGGTFNVAAIARLTEVALKLPIPKSPQLKPIFRSLLLPLKTKQSQARLRMMEHRGKISATMVYDYLPIHDVFRRVDSHCVMGLMDYKALEAPYFFALTREPE